MVAQSKGPQAFVNFAKLRQIIYIYFTASVLPLPRYISPRFNIVKEQCRSRADDSATQ